MTFKLIASPVHYRSGLEFKKLCLLSKSEALFMKLTKSMYLDGQKFEKVNYNQRIIHNSDITKC
jgi:hypothetical protein